MSETMQLMLTLSGALLAGLLLGAIFFGGLWWTVQKGVSARQPALWFVPSFLLRTGITLAGFYFVSGAGWTNPDWKRLLVCLSGFIIARIIITRLTRMNMASIRRTEEVSHAP